MQLQPLPPRINQLLHDLHAPPKLVAHLTLVHATAFTLMNRLKEYWPGLLHDQQAVLIGAATHDIGKISYPQELAHPGNQHEDAGPALLIAHGLPEHYARFARTHAQWQEESAIQLEDLLVAFADHIWKGARNNTLEEEIARQIAQRCDETFWNVYLQLDDIANELAEDAHEKILWQEAIF
jgi:hypothetical protein